MNVRVLRRSPLYSATVILLLGIGVGASGIILTAIEAFLLRPLSVQRPEQLARLGVEASATHTTFDHSSVYASILSQRAQSAASVFTSFPIDAAMVANGQVATVACDVVSDNFFTALGFRPEAGTFFVGTGQKGNAQSAVISHALWRGLFAGQDRAIGSAIRLRGAMFTITGVAPPGFAGLDLERRVEVWVPADAWRVWAGTPDLLHQPAQVFLRLRDGVSLSQAEAEVRVLYPAMVEADLTTDGQPRSSADIARQKDRRTVLVSVKNGISAMRKQLLPAVPVLLGGVVALLVLIAANIGGLMLARTEARRQDTALRLSLGASHWIIIRELVSESLWLSGLGALLACAVAQFGAPQIRFFLPLRQPSSVAVRPDLEVLAVMILSTVAAGLLASLVPASLLTRRDLMHALRRAGNRVSAPKSGRVVVVVQVALATVLVAGSAAFLWSLEGLRNLSPGFDRNRLVVAVLDARISALPVKDLPRLYEEILRRAREMPGTVDASLGGYPLMRGVGYRNTMGAAGTRLTPADRLNVSLNYASETHFQNLGVRLIEGRTVVPSDLDLNPTPVVVTESLAKTFFPGRVALGRFFGPAGPDGVAVPRFRVAGIISDLKYRGMRETAPPTFYSALNGHEELVTLHVRTRLNDAEAIRRTRAMLTGVGPGFSPVTIATMEQEIETSLWQERLLSAISQMFGGLAALVAATGLFGLLAFTLARRMREVGLRMAIGATRENIAALFAKQAASTVGPGILIGCVGFLIARSAFMPLVAESGHGVSGPIFAGIALMLFVGVCAVAVPVFRAITVDPVVALREE